MSHEKGILLVEDTLQDELLTIRALKMHDIKAPVVVCRDGAEALEWLYGTGAHAGRDPSQLPQVVLLDLNLPKVDGLEVLRKIRAHDRTRRLPVVVLTTSKKESDIVNSYDLGASSYVRKPVDYHEFADAIKSLGLFWLVLNESAPTNKD